MTSHPVLVRGTVEPPDPELRVTVNGQPTFMLQGGEWTTLWDLPAGTHDLLVEGRARGQVVSKTERRVTVTGPVPTPWPLLFWGAAPWAGMGIDRGVPVGIPPFEWTFRLSSGSEVAAARLDPEGAGSLTRVLRRGEVYTHHFTAPGIYAPALRYTDQAGRGFTQQGLVLVFDRAWLESILQAQWKDFLAALAQEDLEKAAGLVEVTRRDRFRIWAQFIPLQDWKKWAINLSSQPLVLERLEGYVANCRLGPISGLAEFAPDQADGRWRYYFRDAVAPGVMRP